MPLIYLISLVIFLIVLLAHEFGHYLTARVFGVPTDKMDITVLGFPPRVEFLGLNEFSDLGAHINSTGRIAPRTVLFAVAAGGHLSELVLSVAITLVSLQIGLEWVAVRFVLFSLFIATSYIIASVGIALVYSAPFGDPAQLWALSPPRAVLVYTVFLTVLTGLVWLLSIPLTTVLRFALIVHLVFVPLSMHVYRNAEYSDAI